MKWHLIFIIVLLLGLITGCVSTVPGGNNTTSPQTTSSPSPSPTIIGDNRTCSVNSDCVPEQCCHPTSCINRKFKGVCTLLCTQVCEGPIDCGGGHCECEGGTCQVISSPGALNGTGVTPEGPSLPMSVKRLTSLVQTRQAIPRISLSPVLTSPLQEGVCTVRLLQ
jgi:hypothetical protein